MTTPKRVTAKAAPRATKANARATQQGRGHRHELLAILSATGAVAFALALFSFDPEGGNWVGTAGHQVAGILFHTFGLGAFFLPLGLILVFLGLVLPEGKRPGLIATVAHLLLLFGASLLLDLLAPSLRPFGARPGGELGGTAADLLVGVFSRPGTVVLTLGAMASAWVIATGFRVSRLVLGAGALARRVWAWFQAFVQMQLEQHRAEREALKEEWARVDAAAEEALRNEEATLEADLDGRLPHEAPPPVRLVPAAPEPPPRKAERPEVPAKVEKAARSAAAEEPPAEKREAPEPGAIALPPDPAWVHEESIEAAPAPDASPEAAPAEATAAPVVEPPTPEEPAPAPTKPPEPAPRPEPKAAAPQPKKSEDKGANVPVIELPQAPKPKRSDSPFELIASEDGFSLPPLSLLDGTGEQAKDPIDEQLLHDTAERLRQKLADFGIKGEVERIRPGPVVTMYEFAPAPGVKISRIAGLSDDLAMALEALRVRIVAPIPGRGVVGIEVPNAKRETVYLREILEQDAFRKSKSKLSLAIGKDIEGMPFVADLARMPHLLISGTTGSGKSVSVNAMIMSLLFKATPEEVRLIMVDPKMLELSIYEGIPHLLLPVVTDPRKAALALRWAVDEMERRYALMAENGVRDLAGFNRLVKEKQEAAEKAAAQATEGREAGPTESRTVRVLDLETGESVEEVVEEATPNAPTEAAGEEEEGPKLEKLPYLVIIIDELADLMMVASKEVETYIARIAQKARAAGIHLMVATQRPSVDVVTGLIKANLPSRISFLLRSNTDSRTILDSPGAEKLLGMGDMLILPPTSHHLQRVHGALVTEKEIKKVVDHLKAQGSPVYDESILKEPEEDGEGGVQEEDLSDELYDQAVAIVSEMKSVSISMLQRRMRIGYNRSARMIERMEREGIVGPADGAKPREVLIRPVEP